MPSQSRVILFRVLVTIRLFLDYVTDLFFGFIYKNRSETLPPITDLTLLESATSLAEKIRMQKIKSEDVVKAYISRINQVNLILNAVVDRRFEEAIDEAKEVDKLISSGEKTIDELAVEKPFLGVPFTTKESIQVKGLHNAGGLVARKNIIAEEDAPAIRLMRDAGAIIIAVTNTSELCMWWESNNKIYGRTRNPYNTTRIVGGSSGGEACNLAAAGSVIGIGSDIGGSIRMPCFFNGIFGHKATFGTAPVGGQVPKCEGPRLDYLMVGPMCRYATDLMPIYKVLSKGCSNKLNLDKKVDLKKLKVYYIEDDGGFPLISPVHPELKTAMKKVVYHFDKAHGVKGEIVHIKELFNSLGIWGSKMNQGGKKCFAQLLTDDKGEINIGLEFLKWCLFMSNHTLPALMLSIFEKIEQRGPEYHQRMNDKCAALRSQIQDLLGDNGVLLYPSHPKPAPYHNQPIIQPFNFAYTAIFNMLGFPSTQCPLGLSSAGLPLGVQVIGNLYKDHNTLAVGLELEKAFGGWLPPCQTP